MYEHLAKQPENINVNSFSFYIYYMNRENGNNVRYYLMVSAYYQEGHRAGISINQLHIGM